MFRFRAGDDFRPRFDPFTKQLSANIGGRDAHAAVVADALCLAGIRSAVHIQLLRRAVLRLLGKPHGSAHALPILAKSFDVEILAPLQRGKSRVGHCALDAAILARAQYNGASNWPVPPPQEMNL